MSNFQTFLGHFLAHRLLFLGLMEAMVHSLIPGGLSLLALSTVVGLVRLQRRVTNTQAPVSERLLRSPGESLRARLARIDEKLMWCVALLSVGPVVFSLTAPGFPDKLSIALLLAVTGLCVLAVYIGAKEYRTYSLGLMGERAVGEELNQLMTQGCRVFHDYPGQKNGNIDHVVVAPSGVYAIETRTRQKRRAQKGTSEQQLTFDGAKLHFPRFISTSGLKQARRNAASLSRELSDVTGELVQVKAILALPGWHISRTGSGDVSVLNPKEIRQVVFSKSGPQLSAEQIWRIAQPLEQKCRDVGF
jgi:hypothetical protein